MKKLRPSEIHEKVQGVGMAMEQMKLKITKKQEVNKEEDSQLGIMKKG